MEFRLRNAGSAEDAVQGVASPNPVLQREGRLVQCFLVQRRGEIALDGNA